MNYVMSDLHGRYDLYLKMLEKINPSAEDKIYFLGDYVDRGYDGLEIILDMAGRKNVVALLGNHDYYALTVMSATMHDSDAKSSPYVRAIYDLWMRNDGLMTYEKFKTLNEMKQKRIISILDSLPLYADITVGDRRFTMVHGGIAGYDPGKPLDHYGVRDLVSCREDYSKPKFNEAGRFLVTGHTPTAIIDLSSKGRIYYNHDHIAIDCGAVFGMGLGCLCLDTMEELYVY